MNDLKGAGGGKDANDGEEAGLHPSAPEGLRLTAASPLLAAVVAAAEIFAAVGEASATGTAVADAAEDQDGRGNDTDDGNQGPPAEDIKSKTKVLLKSK